MIQAHDLRYFAVGLWLLALSPVAASAQPTLTAQEIAEAIEWGRSAQPEPYVLRSPFTTNKTPPGVVYTPYVRVALAARSADDQGREFGVEDVTAEMTAPLIYFAIGDHGTDPLATGVLPAHTPLSMRLVTEHSGVNSSRRRVISPVWVRLAIPRYLRFGLRSDWSYALGAFRIEDLQADTRVELYREHREGSRLQVHIAPGLISDADIRAWK